MTPIITIEDALKSGSFHPNTEKCLQKGDVDLCFQSGQCDRIIEGDVHVGGQDHFYLETQCSLVWTMGSGNEVYMISSTQAPQKHQKYVAHVLDLPMSKVVCKTKRLGGGFGGKETRSALIAAVASVPSYLLNRPVKITLDRDTNMMISGQRHNFLGKYKTLYFITWRWNSYKLGVVEQLQAFAELQAFAVVEQLQAWRWLLHASLTKQQPRRIRKI